MAKNSIGKFYVENIQGNLFLFIFVVKGPLIKYSKLSCHLTKFYKKTMYISYQLD
jgi:hypothetical protein